MSDTLHGGGSAAGLGGKLEAGRGWVGPVRAVGQLEPSVRGCHESWTARRWRGVLLAERRPR